MNNANKSVADLRVDILTGSQLSTITKESNSGSYNFMCVVRFSGREVGRTEACLSETGEVVWNKQLVVPIDSAFESKQIENNRPFFFEYIELHLYDTLRSQSDRIGECRLPLMDVGKMKWYKVVRVGSSSEIDHSARIQITLDIDGDIYAKLQCEPHQRMLADIFPLNLPQHHHLYMDLGNNWSPSHLLGCLSLPGPRVGEIVQDLHNCTEWRVVGGTNCFGDKYFIVCKGVLVITDLRVIFLPHEIQSPPWGDVISVHRTHVGPLTDEQLLAVRRMTYQVPLGGIQDCRVSTIDSNAASIIIESKDSCVAEFTVRRPVQTRRQAMNEDSSRSMRKSTMPSRRSLVPSIANITFQTGLESACVAPFLWCSRVADDVMFMVREDRTWIRWALYMKLTCDEFFNSNKLSAAWLRKTRISEEDEYRRLRVQDGEWRMSDLNCSYQLCPTYPQTLVLPASLSDADILAAAQERSRGRISALSWLHPTSKVPLCRSAQPMSGMSGANLEADKRACLAIKTSCPTGSPLRIADARPRMNANANALQGKGFENVAFLGGSSAASITFLDIENIHVMRSSLLKLREGWNANNSSGDGNDYVQASRWLNHVASLLRGAAGMAESILLSYPVMIHCSDGWDRTAQLSGLTQLLLDPYYRTIDGFFALVNKEWCSFGHMFEHRTNRVYTHKEYSPVFLQFLDAVWQIMQQYPASFEYTSHFLTIFAQAAYSGYFTSFRGNSEEERNSLIRRMAPMEDMQLSEMQYSTVFCYVHILLRSEVLSNLLINPYYHPPAAASSTVHYLRVRTGVHDMNLWKDGLVGFNKQQVQVSMGPQLPGLEECVSSTSLVSNRFHGYLNLHKKDLDWTVRERLDVFLMSSSITGGSSQVLGGIPIYYQSKAGLGPMGVGGLVSYRDYSLGLDVFDVQNTLMEAAAAKIQIWFRTIMNVNRGFSCWLTEHQDHSSHDSDDERESYSVCTKARGVCRALTVLAVSELKMAHSLRNSVKAASTLQIQGIIDEVVEEALIRCMRQEAAERCIRNDSLLRQSMMESSYSSNSIVGAVSAASQLTQTMSGRFASMALAAATSVGAVSSPTSSSKDSINTNGAGSADSPQDKKKKTFTKRMIKMVTGGGGAKEKDRERDGDSSSSPRFSEV